MHIISSADYRYYFAQTMLIKFTERTKRPGTSWESTFVSFLIAAVVMLLKIRLIVMQEFKLISGKFRANVDTML